MVNVWGRQTAKPRLESSLEIGGGESTGSGGKTQSHRKTETQLESNEITLRMPDGKNSKFFGLAWLNICGEWHQ